MGNRFSASRMTKRVRRVNTTDQGDISSGTMNTHQEGALVTDTITATNLTALGLSREFHNEESSTYWLPKDDEEQMRLTGQHFAIKDLYGGNVLSGVINTLDFEKGITILDMGCGSGAWIMDMMRDYPNCTYHGCDISDTRYKKVNIEKFIFTCGNVVKGLPYEDNTFDFVHMRLLVLALREEEWPTAISELIRVTKPGGMIQLLEMDLRQQQEDDPSGALYKVGLAVRNICTSKGQNPSIGTEFEKMLSKYSNIKIIQSDDRSCDMSTGTNTAKLFIWDSLQVLKSMRPVLALKLGLKTDEEYDSFSKEFEHHIKTKESRCFYNSIAVQKL
ncbi:S-adenosyl-L-methionine-dependent methyltransferase [Rhizopus microsporus var. microsporus]|nr:S-adenosyl-L-methionine-dependent methyltransferase [Rhizopus microsporus var. microsporus]